MNEAEEMHPPSCRVTRVASSLREACCLYWMWEHISWSVFLTEGMSVSTVGLVAIKDAQDIETRLNEVEKLLKTIISMPCKVSGSGLAGWDSGTSQQHPRSWPAGSLGHLPFPESVRP